MQGVIVIGYDGSDAARRALDTACRLFRETSAIVVNVWEPAQVAAARTPPAAVGAHLPVDTDDPRVEVAARRVAEHGAALAVRGGLGALPLARRGGAADLGLILEEVAEEYAADLIVVARTDASWVERAVIGSASKEAVREARRPVLVVPPHGDSA